MIDSRSGCAYLVDTGWRLPLFPQTCVLCSPCLLNLCPSSRLQMGPPFRLFFVLSSQPYTSDFILADVLHPLLGAGFLQTHCLLVDIAGGCLICVKDLCSVLCHHSAAPLPAMAMVIHSDIISHLPDYCPHLLQPAPSYGICHHMPTQGWPVWTFPAACPNRYGKVRVQTLQHLGIICPSHSEWVSPLLMAPR